MRAATRSGMASEDVYFPKLWCFNELRFLLDANDEIRGQSNLETDKLDDSFRESELSCSSTKKAKRSRLQEVSALRQSANKLMEVVTSFIEKRSVKEDDKEETFCKMLRCELKEFKLVESYENVTREILSVVHKAKSEEREKIYWQVPSKTTDFYSESSSSESLYGKI